MDIGALMAWEMSVRDAKALNPPARRTVKVSRVDAKRYAVRWPMAIPPDVWVQSVECADFHQHEPRSRVQMLHPTWRCPCCEGDLE